MELEDISIEVIRKDIKNLYVRIQPPKGDVTISAPRHASMSAIRQFAVSRLRWIRRHRAEIQARAREPVCEYVDSELHNVWGKLTPLTVAHDNARPHVELLPSRILLCIRPEAGIKERETALARWYRDLLRDEISSIVSAWEPRLGVRVRGFSVRQMRTRWGSCSMKRGTIRLSTELAKKPKECLEYTVVHEMIHLLEPSHGPAFRRLMDEHMPNWAEFKRALNHRSIGHGNWLH